MLLRHIFMFTYATPPLFIVWPRHIWEGTDWRVWKSFIHVRVRWWTQEPRNDAVMKCVRSVNETEILSRLSSTWIQYLVPGSHSRISDPFKYQAVNWIFSLGLNNSCYLWSPLSRVSAPADLEKTSQTSNHIQITCTKNMGNEKILNNSFIRILGKRPTWRTIPFYVFICIFNSLHQRFSNFFQVGTTFISQNVLRTTLLLGLSNSLGLP